MDTRVRRDDTGAYTDTPLRIQANLASSVLRSRFDTSNLISPLNWPLSSRSRPPPLPPPSKKIKDIPTAVLPRWCQAVWVVGGGQVKASDSSVARLGCEVVPKLTSLREKHLLQSRAGAKRSLLLSLLASVIHWSRLTNCKFLPVQDSTTARQTLTKRPYIQSVCWKLVRKNGG